MSIQTEISRLEAAKAGIKAAIEAKGISVSDEIKLDGYGAKIEEIQSGGVELPAGTWVIVKGYTNAKTYVAENFTVPLSGTYRITVIAKGGSGSNGDGEENYSGAGGGSGGWACSALNLIQGDSIQVT